MKKSDIYEIVIKIFGLYMAISIVVALRSLLVEIYQIFAFIGNPFESPRPHTDFMSWFIVFFELLSFAFYAWVLWSMIFRTKRIVKKITVESDYEENAKLFAEKQTILEIAFVIIGGIIVVWSFPEMIEKIYYYFMDGKYRTGLIVTTVVQFIFGLLIFLDAKPLAKYFAKEKTE